MYVFCLALSPIRKHSLPYRMKCLILGKDITKVYRNLLNEVVVINNRKLKGLMSSREPTLVSPI